MMEGDGHIQESREENVESTTSSQPPQNPRKKKNKIEKKRRFSDEQIRSLECIFESESKLEPRKKLQLARDLGLQPRQVAIWFQNKRARWKSKRTEQEYRKLKDEYDNLASRFENLKKEKESLQIELQKLSDRMKKSVDGRRESTTWVAKDNNKEDGGSGSGHSNWRGDEAKPSYSNEGLEDREAMHSHDENEKSYEDREHQIQKMEKHGNEHVEVPLASVEKWYSVDPSSLLDQSCSSSQWLDFWT
ncbi:hypothetical protein L6164_016375 [Bauhinia variegata]|uniref:Uncharacterized protein n=1 Tax=Bauhinia variegata TaxID=167791 RepID=A0ACB9NNG5_BAUVA|nr:hypothetical protein L6164_016375 [Bauhinia variegata]